MKRPCDICGREYEAKRPTSKYCTSGCRTKASRAPKQAPLGAVPTVSDLAAVTERSLLSAGVLDTIAGQQAMVLARRIGSPAETGAAVASMSKQLQVVVGEALKSVQAVDPLDQLRARRDAKRGVAI